MQTTSPAIRALRFFGINHLVRGFFKVSPAPMRRWYENKQKIRGRARLVHDQAVRECFEKVVGILQKENVEIGDYLEFGVYNGSTMTWMQRTLQKAGMSDVRIFGFDSFEGLPDYAVDDCGGHWKPGEFSSSLEFTKSVLEHEGVDMERVHLVKGFFHDSCTPELRERHSIKRSALVMIDCDLYQSTVDAFNFCEPIFAETTIVMFDDWYPLADRNEGEKRAFDEFLALHPEWTAEQLFPYEPQGMVYKMTRKSGS